MNIMDDSILYGFYIYIYILLGIISYYIVVHKSDRHHKYPSFQLSNRI